MSKKQLSLQNKTNLITGVAGFIGLALAKCICLENLQTRIIRIDSVNFSQRLSFERD